jgi:hypothetical protein
LPENVHARKGGKNLDFISYSPPSMQPSPNTDSSLPSPSCEHNPPCEDPQWRAIYDPTLSTLFGEILRTHTREQGRFLTPDELYDLKYVFHTTPPTRSPRFNAGAKTPLDILKVPDMIWDTLDSQPPGTKLAKILVQHLVPAGEDALKFILSQRQPIVVEYWLAFPPEQV